MVRFLIAPHEYATLHNIIAELQLQTTSTCWLGNNFPCTQDKQCSFHTRGFEPVHFNGTMSPVKFNDENVIQHFKRGLRAGQLGLCDPKLLK